MLGYTKIYNRIQINDEKLHLQEIWRLSPLIVDKKKHLLIKNDPQSQFVVKPVNIRALEHFCPLLKMESV